MARLTKTWWLKPETIKRLKVFGQYGETQDTLINRILDELEYLKNKLVK
jgi:hypothetical protein